VAGSERIVAYRELASGHDCLEQKPETLCSLRQKVWSLVVLSLKLQKSVPMTLQTRSSLAMVGKLCGLRRLRGGRVMAEQVRAASGVSKIVEVEL